MFASLTLLMKENLSGPSQPLNGLRWPFWKVIRLKNKITWPILTAFKGIFGLYCKNLVADLGQNCSPAGPNVIKLFCT